VAILNPNHLLEQADKLIAGQGAGAPRQADLRRAISAAYYAVFHVTLGGLADLFVGFTNRPSSRYALVYRSVDHVRLRMLCDVVRRSNLPDKYKPYVPTSGIGPNLRTFASAVIHLQQKRHLADYDTLFRANSSDANVIVNDARAALIEFKDADAVCREAFLTLLLIEPRH
jgi:hypothetical protein